MSTPQPNEPQSESRRQSSLTPLSAAQAMFSLLSHSSSPRDSSADARTPVTQLDAQTVLSLLLPSTERRNSSDGPTPASAAALGAAQTIISRLSSSPASRESPGESPTSAAPVGSARITDTLPEQPSTPQIIEVSQHDETQTAPLPPPASRESPSDSDMSAAPVGMVRTTVSLNEPPSTPRGAQVPQPRPEPIQEHSAHVSQRAPAETPRSGVEPTFPAPIPVSFSHDARRERRESSHPRGTARSGLLYPPRHDASLPPLAIPTSTRHLSDVPYVNSEMAWHTPDGRKHPRGRNIAARLEPTILTARHEMEKAAKQAQRSKWLLNIAIGLQVFLGALTTALGASLTGKSITVAISVLGGASTLVASYLARMRGSNEPDMSMRRKNALNHFLREIEGFTLDHEYEAGPEWDEKIKGFRHGLESILGNGPGSVMVKGEAGANANIGQDNLKGMGGHDSIAGLNVNGKYFANNLKSV